MKKLIVLCMTLVSILTLAGCELLKKAEIVVAFAEMENLDSYKMDITIELDGEELLTSYAYIAGDYQEIHILGETQGLFYIDGTYYEITKLYGLPILEETETIEEDDYDDFNLYSDYEFIEDEDGYYVLEGEMEVFDGVEKIKFKLENNKIKEMILEGEMEILEDTYEMAIIVDYSEYNAVDIDVPTYLTNDEVEVMEEYIDALNIHNIIAYDRGFSINATIVIDCFDNSCFIEASPGLDYNLETKEVSVQEQDTWVSYETYVSNNTSDTVTLEFFEFVHLFDELNQKYK